MMRSIKNIDIPEHWLIDTSNNAFWPYSEGAWVNAEDVSILRLACVYLCLLDIPEAKQPLTKCNESFINENIQRLSHWYDQVIKEGRARRFTEVCMLSPFQSETEAEKAASIYKPWVHDWALDSEKMWKWVVGKNIFDTTFNWLGFSQRELKRLNARIFDLGSNATLPQPWAWVWKTLLSGEYRRVEQENRKLARRFLQSRGYYCVRERTLLTGARSWIAIRILGHGETEYLQQLGLGKEISNFSNKVLKPFDDALCVRPKTGRPFGAKTTEIMKVTKKYLG